MRVVFVRHGIAEDSSDRGDEFRRLTPEGRDKTRAAMRGLRELDVRPDRIFTSPLLRARETAEIAEDLLGGEVEELDCLKPGGNFPKFLETLEHLDAAEVLAVGHMPDIAEFAQRCLTGRVTFAMTFKKAAAMCVEFDGEPAAGRGRLEWLLQPSMLRALGKT